MSIWLAFDSAIPSTKESENASEFPPVSIRGRLGLHFHVFIGPGNGALGSPADRNLKVVHGLDQAESILRTGDGSANCAGREGDS